MHLASSVRLPSLSPFSSSRFTRTMSAFVLGIRAEDPRRLWERRVPCLPADVAKLLGDPSLQPLRIIVQPSEKRCVPDSAYIEAGAEIKKDLSEADAIIGVKEVPAVEILRDDKAAKRTYLAFSHVHKAQGYNMPLLAEMLASKSKFIGASPLSSWSEGNEGRYAQTGSSLRTIRGND